MSNKSKEEKIILNQKSPRLIFTVIILILLLSSPLIVLFFPLAVTETLYFHRDNIVLLTPPKNFLLIGIAIVMVIVGLVILAIKRSLSTYAITSFLLIGSLATVYFSTLSYTAIQHSQIIKKEYHTTNNYKWQDLQQVTYEYEIGTVGTYHFLTKDNQAFSIKENGQFGTEEKRAIYKSSVDSGVTFTEQEKEKQ